MTFKKNGDTYVIKLEKGEPVFKTLSTWCEKEKVTNAHFSGIGAVKDLSCGYYALGEKKYYFTKYPNLVEVVSMTGNVALKDGVPFLHVHGVFTDTENKAFGGHIEEMTVGVTLEIVLHSLNSDIARKPDESIGLSLLELPCSFT